MTEAVNLPRVRAALASIEAVLAAHPEIRTRTAELFASDPTPAELRAMEGENVSKQPINMRVDAAILERAEALLPAIAVDPKVGALAQASRATVLRLAMLEGLAVLERRYSKRKTEGEGEA